VKFSAEKNGVLYRNLARFWDGNKERLFRLQVKFSVLVKNVSANKCGSLRKPSRRRDSVKKADLASPAPSDKRNRAALLLLCLRKVRLCNVYKKRWNKGEKRNLRNNQKNGNRHCFVRCLVPLK